MHGYTLWITDRYPDRCMNLHWCRAHIHINYNQRAKKASKNAQIMNNMGSMDKLQIYLHYDSIMQVYIILYNIIYK